MEEYSYAKYYKNQLIAQSGSFQYSLSFDTYRNMSNRLDARNHLMLFDGFNHLIYYVNKNSVIIVSLPETLFFDKLVSFSYLFLFFYLILLLYTGTNNFSRIGRDIDFNFKNKIQLSIIAVLIPFPVARWRGYNLFQHNAVSEKTA